MYRQNGLRAASVLLIWGTVGGAMEAHQIQVDNTIGGTLHIEPNDIARAGEPTQLWFALTQRGGATVPLAACSCRLSIYRAPYTPGDPPQLQPELTAVATAGYSQIPGATVVFPEVGSYVLQLTGDPQAPGAFSSFTLAFEVTVAVAASPNSAIPKVSATPAVPPPSSSTPPPTSASRAELWTVPITAVSLVLVAGMVWSLRNRYKS